MSDAWIIRVSLFLASVIPFALACGWGEYGAHSIMPWSVGFLTQTGFVLGYIGQQRGWRRAR